jgi:hypothetical protein
VSSDQLVAGHLGVEVRITRPFNKVKNLTAQAFFPSAFCLLARELPTIQPCNLQPFLKAPDHENEAGF